MRCSRWSRSGSKAALSWDIKPVHTDAELMASSRFGERISRGILGVAVAVGLSSRIGVFASCALGHVSPALEMLAFWSDGSSC
jgi:acyl dehydratase